MRRDGRDALAKQGARYFVEWWRQRLAGESVGSLQASRLTAAQRPMQSNQSSESAETDESNPKTQGSPVLLAVCQEAWSKREIWGWMLNHVCLGNGAGPGPGEGSGGSDSRPTCESCLVPYHRIGNEPPSHLPQSGNMEWLSSILIGRHVQVFPWLASGSAFHVFPPTSQPRALLTGH
jgi:hypothetical protein